MYKRNLQNVCTCHIWVPGRGSHSGSIHEKKNLASSKAAILGDPVPERLLKTTHVPTHDVPAIGAFGQRLHLRSPQGTSGENPFKL